MRCVADRCVVPAMPVAAPGCSMWVPVGTPGGPLMARPMATQQVDVLLTLVQPPELPSPPVPTPPTIAALTPPGPGAGGPGDPLNPFTKAGTSPEEDEERFRQAGDGVGPPAPVAAAGPVEPPFVEPRPMQIRGAVRSLEFEPNSATTWVNPATREVDRLVRERPGSGC